MTQKDTANSPTSKPRPKLNTRSLMELLSLLRGRGGIFTLAMIALALGAAVNLLLPEILRRLLTPEFESYITNDPGYVAIGFCLLFGIQGILFYARSYLFGKIGQQVVAKLRSDLYEAIIRREIAFFDSARSGDLVSRLSADTQLVQDAITLRLSVLIRYGFQVLVGTALMFTISLRLAMAIVTCVPILVILSVILGKRLRILSKAQQAEIARSSAMADETFSGIRVVRAFNQDTPAISRFEEVNSAVLDIGIKRLRVSAFFSSFISALLNICIVGVVLYGILLVNGGELSKGDLAAFIAYGVIVSVSFAFVAGSYGELLQSLGASERVFELLNERVPPESSLASNSSLPSLTESSIKFSNVSFAYPSRPDHNTLQEISLTLEAGKKTALVGPSGSGKSTIVSLLLGFYKTTNGKIEINGSDFSAYSAHEIRERIGVVPQDSQLFGLSVAENLRIGKPDATDAELENACRDASILDFIKGLPRGFDTPVGERGIQLSGGQKQRIAIARAMLRDPELLILDEATSALDSENEALVHQALSRLMKGRTVLIIAHRLSTIQDADSVYVLESGKIVQHGSHHALASTPGLYQELVARQELR